MKNGIIYPRDKRPFDGSFDFEFSETPEGSSSGSCSVEDQSRVDIPKVLPTLQEIEVMILTAKSDATKELAALGQSIDTLSYWPNHI